MLLAETLSKCAHEQFTWPEVVVFLGLFALVGFFFFCMFGFSKDED